MTVLDDLFDWLLEEIFKKLNRHDRLICKEVCKHWYNILMERAVFREDRRIYIKTSEIIAGEPSISVLLQAKKAYVIYTIRDDSNKIPDDIMEFFDQVGANIEEIKYAGNAFHYGMFTKMTSLKSLSLVGWINFEKYFPYIKAKKPDFTFEHLEQLQIEELSHWDEAIDNINNIRKLIPNNCSLVFSRAEINFKLPIEQISSVMDVIKINKLYVYGIKDMEKLLEINYINCDKLVLHRNDDQSPYALVEAIQNMHQDVKKIKLVSQFLPPVGIALPKLTTLHFSDLNAPMVSLKAVEQLQNLEELQLRFELNGCLFGHEPISLPKLKSIDIAFTNVCHECLEAIADSFESLEDFQFALNIREQFTWMDFKNLTNKWPNYIRSLRIDGNFDLKLEEVAMISETFPNLEKFELSTRKALPLSNVIRAILPALKKLTRFFFVNECPSTEIEYIHDYLDNIGFPVEEEASSFLKCESYSAVQLTFDHKKMTSIICYI